MTARTTLEGRQPHGKKAPPIRHFMATFFDQAGAIGEFRVPRSASQCALKSVLPSLKRPQFRSYATRPRNAGRRCGCHLKRPLILDSLGPVGFPLLVCKRRDESAGILKY